MADQLRPLVDTDLHYESRVSEDTLAARPRLLDAPPLVEQDWQSEGNALSCFVPEATIHGLPDDCSARSDSTQHQGHSTREAVIRDTMRCSSPVGSHAVPPQGPKRKRSASVSGPLQLPALARRLHRAASQKRRIVNRCAYAVLLLTALAESSWIAAGAMGLRRTSDTPPPPRIDVDARMRPDRAVTSHPTVAQHAAQPVDGVEPLGTMGTNVSDTRQTTRQSPSVRGAVSIAAPFQVEVYEKGRFVGISEGKSIPLNPGSHQLDLVNESLRYRAMQKVTVTAGRTTSLTADLPTGTLHVNATPWADVFIDGRNVGETPLANLQVPIGPHVVVFHHPQFGERTRRVVVSTGSTTRMGVNLQE